MVSAPQYPLQPDRDRLATMFASMTALETQMHGKTLEVYQYHVLRYLHWCAWDPTRAFDPASLHAWRDALVQAGQLRPRTINRRAALLTLLRLSAAGETLDERLVFKFGLIPAVKHAPLRDRLKTFTPLTPAQVRALCRCPDPLSLIGLRDRALLVLASSACRIHEVLSLTRASLVPLATGWGLHVLGKGQAKARLAPLSHEAYDAITRWLTACDMPCAWLFTSFTHDLPTDQPLDRATAWRLIKRYGQQIGRPDIAPHDFRRFLGTQTAAKYGIRQAQKALGHASISSTEKYVLDDLPPQLTEDLF